MIVSSMQVVDDCHLPNGRALLEMADIFDLCKVVVGKQQGVQMLKRIQMLQIPQIVVAVVPIRPSTYESYHNS